MKNGFSLTNKQNKGINMKDITLYMPNEPDVSFNGVLLGEVRKEGDPYPELWYTLYKTKAGKFICLNHLGCGNAMIVCETEAEVVDFFGYSDSSKELYSASGINDKQTID